MSNNSTALARQESVEPSTMAELKDFADIAARSRFFGAETKEQALILAMAGKDLGFSYTQALRAFYVVKGRPTLSADGMVAACIQHPNVCEYFRPVEVTEQSATWETKPRGGDPIRYRFTMQDAERAGLVTDMYRRHPKRMLSARCKAYLARDVYPQLLMGLLTEDEASEAGAPRTVVTAEVVRSTHEQAAEPVLSPSDAAMARGAELATPAERKAFWQSIAGQAKSWTNEERQKVIAYFRDLDADYARAQAPAPAPATEVIDAEVV